MHGHNAWMVIVVAGAALVWGRGCGENLTLLRTWIQNGANNA
jgi:hypothetical protein